MNKDEIRKHYLFTTTHELDDDNKLLKDYILNLENELDIANKKLEEIKTICMVYLITPCPDYMKVDTRTEKEVRADVATTLKLFDEVFDKYKDKEEELKKYKNAWEEIMNFYKVELKDTMGKYDRFVLYILEKIAKENGIEVK